jgi:Predicted inhibitor of MCP methylation, homolog of CheC
MNAAYINPFLSSTIDLFEKTFGITPVAGEAFLDDRSRKHRWDISAVMVLTGSAIGVVAIRLTRLLADKLLRKSGVQWNGEEERERLCDGMVGEMVNIISGNASGQLEGYEIEISVPIVIQGENHTVSWPERAPIIGVPFSTDYGPFLVNISLIELPKIYQKSHP